MQVILRDISVSDSNDLLTIFRDAVSVTGLDAYPLQQVMAWLSTADDDETFIKDIQLGISRIAVNRDGRAVGFAQMYPLGHIRMLYVLPQMSRRGVGSVLLADLLRKCRDSGWHHLTTDASRISQPLFTRFGFEIVEVEQVERHGVWIERFRMEKYIDTMADIFPSITVPVRE